MVNEDVSAHEDEIHSLLQKNKDFQLGNITRYLYTDLLIRSSSHVMKLNLERLRGYCIYFCFSAFLQYLFLSETFTFQKKPLMNPLQKRQKKNIYLASSSQKVVSSDIQGFEGSGGTRKGSYSKYCSV